MEFLVIGRDGDDEGGPSRRAAVRERHLAGITGMVERGELRYAASIRDESGVMRGSMLVCEFASREALDGWLDTEPYVTGGVWKSISVEPCATAPAFRK